MNVLLTFTSTQISIIPVLPLLLVPIIIFFFSCLAPINLYIFLAYSYIY